MANTKLGNIARNDVVVFKDELDADPPIDKGDINATGIGASKILAVNAGNTALEWIDQTGSATDLSALGDTNITTPTDGALLVYDLDTAKWRDATVSGAITITDTGLTTLEDGVVNVQHLANGAGELGTRLIGVKQTALNGTETGNEIEVSIGFVTLNNDPIDFSSGFWGGIVPCVRVIVSPTVNGPKKHTSAYVSAVTQGISVDGLNTADALILGTEPATGTHIKFKVKMTTAGTVYVFLGNPDVSYWSIFQYLTSPISVVFA